MRASRKAFTLIEVLVSVALISIALLGIVKIREQNLDAAAYIERKMHSSLSDTLFLDKSTLPRKGRKEDAYSLLQPMGIRRSETQSLLRNISRTIDWSDPLPTGEIPMPLEVRELRLQGEFPRRYYRLFY